MREARDYYNARNVKRSEKRVQPGSGLSWGAADILLRVRRIMNEAEEISGPEGEDYIKLMQAIVEDARQRIEDYRRILAE